MSPIDTVLSRLDRPRPNGRDRWRSRCPACGGSNKSALSIGIGDNECVMLTCWKGCTVHEVAGALGLDLQDLFPSKDAQASSPRRRRMLTAQQALDILDEEANFVFSTACSLAHGVPLADGDRARCIDAAAHVAYLRDEVSQ
jgi:hypothetical protein